MSSIEDTIAAIATPHGRGGIAVIRVSGSKALDVAKELTGTTPEPRKAYFKQFKLNNDVIDEGVLLYFKAPNSYTGEEVIELQGHGGNVAPQRVLKAVLSIDGVRQAEPGEFTRRAFLNNKMDLTAAEAVEDLISAGSEGAAKAALASLEGAFAKNVNELSERITNFRVRLEACLDFPEEHEDFFESGKTGLELVDIEKLARHTLEVANQGVKLNEGARIVLSGSPNAGKSSLLNALAGADKAIVTNIPGTTRDVLTAQIEVEGVPVIITDTAGIRDTPSDEIEAIGIQKAIDELKKADLVLFMIDGSEKADDALETFNKIKEFETNENRIMVVVSKSDKGLCDEIKNLLSQEPLSRLKQIKTSTKTEDGLNELKQELTSALGIIPTEGVFIARRRHVSSLEVAYDFIKRAKDILDTGDLVLCAQEIREAQDHLGTITGAVTSDDILGKIFSTFCIGK
ncbi:MAG: tRNA uridine-5-carboxymethylaminomethyl(34) synthesis GTPase MnmE [Succinatimonas sp.]|jgi:tRNA modification GTPase|nr:tRNA uridine-5-carboxymethylaminomethyl(34) synthesis GTPase MnmE [Succinatimonas sp.]MDY5722702.1 tRNA uridine-5-carboxymethylaminomethyl(34) synthesis GTPase MnmE [Succinivibrio sp.]